MTQHSIEPSTRKYVQRYGFLSFGRNFPSKYKMIGYRNKCFQKSNS